MGPEDRSTERPLPGSRRIIGSAGGPDLGPVRYLGNRDIPPSPARGCARRRIGGDDDNRSAPLGPYRWQNRLEFSKARHLARIGAQARGMAGKIDPRAAREEVIE